MADQLLSIQDSSLQGIANSIKSKCGISTSTKLEFPGDASKTNSFVGALKEIETEITITPKISPQQKTLTLNDTSFAISPGFHDGTGAVKINTQSKTVTPSSSQQTVTPDANYFLSSVLVKGIGSGKQVATGTFTQSGSSTVTISGFGSFQPSGIAGFLIDRNGISKDRTAAFQSFRTDVSYASVTVYNRKFWEGRSVGTSGMFSFSNNSVTLSFSGTNINNFNGTYFYVVWG